MFTITNSNFKNIYENRYRIGIDFLNNYILVYENVPKVLIVD